MSKKVMSAVTMRRPNRSQPGHMSIVSLPKQITTSRASTYGSWRGSPTVSAHMRPASVQFRTHNNAHTAVVGTHIRRIRGLDDLNVVVAIETEVRALEQAPNPTGGAGVCIQAPQERLLVIERHKRLALALVLYTLFGFSHIQPRAYVHDGFLHGLHPLQRLHRPATNHVSDATWRRLPQTRGMLDCGRTLANFTESGPLL